ncbi:efflux transporter outer membrane subunit [Gluconacetobacter entanii]|uniref:efflux transporter outer membrane subunit n=1 Tax=Gluconacetobacter entanii TaxID=108528 RepID=UPI001C931CA0|nr:efflux transporter outer membrane subunit [Gluconacetobacter entanii]MBY4641661.1 efflux transporter outer membrane subunit [Gluconacetobacter entanii]MCW4581132.1 efflux transporter outer membrane subunit [Gluconacetobacter entanii]MCW4584392.1 efflux transporter outer membrane subunit [Gluconacetobacter entanii]MCW4587806.1 efflux transporter outer membrane subunit [Gluconacetobacter entanii]
MKRSSLHGLALGTAAALLAGCTMIPHYKRPAAPVSQNWPTYGGDSQAVGENTLAANLGWSEFFTDARLKALIAIAIRDNRDLREAAANIRRAQGQFDIQHAGLFPQIGGNGGAMFQGPSSAAGLSFAPGLDAQANPPLFKYFNMGIGFSSYEIDLFGRIRSLSREAAEHALMQRENARAMLISVISQVANAYISWLGDEQALHLSEATQASQQATLDMTRAKFEHGEADQLTLRQAETQVEQSAAFAADSRRHVEQDKNLITLLIGAPIPDNLPPASPFGQQTVLRDLPPGLPSDVLEHRPDIISAEHDLKAANADIGAAKAAFYPRITLTASDGISSLQPHRLFTSAATTWGVSPQLQVPLLSWGQNSGNLKASRAMRNVKVAAYEKTVQTAFREVADALAARAAYHDEGEQVDKLVTASADAYRLAKMRYEAGTDSYLTSLESQRSLYQAQQWQIFVLVSKYQNLVTLYRALGGGWTEKTVQNTAPATKNPGKQG